MPAGRTHQLRVHLSCIGHPIVGDSLYGIPTSPEQVADVLMLHALKPTLPKLGQFSDPVAVGCEL